MEERDGFYFHRSFWESISLMSPKDQMAVFKAIVEFGLDGTEPEKLTNNQKAAYLLVRPILQKGRNKAASGKKGGSKKEANGKQKGSKKNSASGLLLSDKGLGSNSNELRLGTRDKGVNDNGEAPPAQAYLFAEFWNAYPENRRTGREEAWESWKALDPTTDMVDEILGNLSAWKASRQWTEDGGSFIPLPKNFLDPERGYLKNKPTPARQDIPKGASGVLGEAELEAIRMTLAADISGFDEESEA